MARGEEAVVVIDQEAAPLVVTEPIGDDDVMERQLCPSAASPEEKSGVQQAALIESEIRSEMAEAESRNDISGGGCDDGGRATASGACSGVAGDEFVTALASMSCSESSESTSCCAEASEYVTASMRELQIETDNKISRARGWSELVVRRAGDGSSGDDQSLWEQLKQRYPCTFIEFEDRLRLEGKIAEGGQSDIYEAMVIDQGRGRPCVAKVFKMEGFSLKSLQLHWPLVSRYVEPRAPVYWWSFGDRPVGLGDPIFDRYMPHCQPISKCTILKDGRFAFIMDRCWGDLRTLIDLRKREYHLEGALPFPHIRTMQMMLEIATGVKSLHDRGVLHRDLKAANVLIQTRSEPLVCHSTCHVADYESSMFVVGTGFWRAPEVLEHLLKKPCEEGDVSKVWTEKSDVYGFAMTCYELWTGDIPFNGYTKRDWKRVIDGERPHLPDYVPLGAQELIRRCWHKEPSERPIMRVIKKELKEVEKNWSSWSDYYGLQT